MKVPNVSRQKCSCNSEKWTSVRPWKLASQIGEEAKSLLTFHNMNSQAGASTRPLLMDTPSHVINRIFSPHFLT
jgi:hypothetical protein